MKRYDAGLLNDYVRAGLLNDYVHEDCLEQLKRRVAELESERDSWEHSYNQVISQIKTMSEEIEDLNDYKDILQCLGDFCGCDHVENQDDRIVQKQHIEEEFEKREQRIVELEEQLKFANSLLMDKEKESIEQLELLEDAMSMFYDLGCQDLIVYNAIYDYLYPPKEEPES